MNPAGQRPVESVRRVALVTATLASFLTPFMGSAINVALPEIGRELRLDAPTLGWIQTSYLLSAAVFLVPFGKLADMHGRKRVFVAGLVLYTLASVLCAMVAGAGGLLAARAIQGIGGGMIFGTSVALITSIFPGGRRGSALGINTAAVYLGLSLGPFLGGLLTEHFGWRSVFLVNAAVGTFTALAAARGLVETRGESGRQRFDAAGSAIYAVALGAVMYGLGRFPSADAGLLVIAGLAGLAVFWLRELRIPHPVLDVTLFHRSRVFTLSNLAALAGYAATYAVSFLLSLYLQYVGGLGPEGAGTVLVIQPLVQAVVSPFAGRLSDRIDARFVASSGMALIAAGLALLILLREGTPLGFVGACLALLGVGFGLFSSPNTNAVMASVEARAYGVGSATLATMRLVGQMLSMGLAGMILALFVGRDAVAPERHQAFLAALRVAFVLFSVLSVAATLASLARGRTATAS